MSPRMSCIAALAIIIGIAAPASAAAGRGATAVMEKAIKQRSAGDLDSAIRNLRTAVETSETNGQRSLANFMLGDCLMEAGRTTDAAKIYHSILSGEASDEERSEALFRLAQCSKAGGDIPGMKKFCSQIAAEYPDTPFAELARLLSRSAAAEQAATEAIAAVSTTPETSPEAPVKAAEPADPVPAKSTRPVPTYEGVDDETIAAMQPLSAPIQAPIQAQTPAPTPKPEPKAEPKPVAALPAQTAVPEASPDSSETTEKPAPPAPRSEKPLLPKPAEPSQKAVPAQDIADLTTLATLSGEEREALATQILHDQELIKTDPKADGTDEILLRIAEATARFGEPLESCKIYDRILTEFPRSKYIERAYFEGIRLRAIIGLRPMVSQWGKVFLQSFPKSRRASDVRRLVAWADQAPSAAAAAAVKARPSGKMPVAAADSSSHSYTPDSDPRYRQAKRRVADNRFALAMNDFQVLTDAHPGVPSLWWDLALVQIQLQQYDEAEESLNRLLALQPENQDARSLLGYVHYHKKDYNQAADDYRQAGASESDGLKFFDSQTAARRMERSSKSSKPSSTREGGNE